MDEVFINPFDLLRLQGLIGSILIIPFFYLYFFVKCKTDDDDDNDYFNYCKYSFSNLFKYFKVIFTFKSKLRLVFVIINYILFVFECSIVNIYRVLNTKFFSPMYRAICDSIMMPLIMIIYFTIDDDNRYPKILVIDFIVYIPIIFFSLVFNEIIILKFWNLSYNTFEEIAERARNKEILSLENELQTPSSDDDRILPDDSFHSQLSSN
jgi:hypothetical protein